MDIRKLQRTIVDGLEDVKAVDVAVFNTEHLSPLFERVIVASGNSNRQTKALAASVREAVRAAGGDVLSVEGEDNGEWIIVDCGAAVAHIMQPAIRQYYHLEEIWGGKTVRLKKAGAGQGLPKASEGASAPASARAPRAASPKTSARGSSAQEALAESARAVKSQLTRKKPARKLAFKTAAAGARTGAARPAGAPAAKKVATARKPRAA